MDHIRLRSPYRELLAGVLGAITFAAMYFPDTGLVWWLSGVFGVGVMGLGFWLLPSVPEEVIHAEVARDESALELKMLETAVATFGATLAEAKAATHDAATKKRFEEMQQTLAALLTYVKKHTGRTEIGRILALFGDAGMLSRFARRVHAYVEFTTDDLLRSQAGDGLKRMEDEVFPGGERYLNSVVKQLTDQRLSGAAIEDETFRQLLNHKLGTEVPIHRKEST